MNLLDFFKKEPENFDSYGENLHKTISIYHKKTQEKDKNNKMEIFLYASLAFITGILISKLMVNSKDSHQL